jgi:hypothetical protein
MESRNIPYDKIKTALIKKNMFFGKGSYLTTTPKKPTYNELGHIIRILDCVKEKMFHRPFETNNGLTMRRGWGVEINGLSTGYLYQFNTTEGSWLAILKEKHDSLDKIAAECYKGFSSTMGSFSKATRDVLPSDRQLQWVWFRKPGYKLTNEIVERAGSWIVLNPGYTFNLWTNLKDAVELDDFIPELRPENRELFSKITVHYADEFERVVFDWLSSEGINKETIDIMRHCWTSTERQDMVMKTDYTRNIILAKFGGMYADFNDCLCLSPIEPVLERHAGTYLGVSDQIEDSYASNYWIYSTTGSENSDWNTIVKRCLETLPYVKDLIYCPEAFPLAKKVFDQMKNRQFPDMDEIQCYMDSENAKFKSVITYNANEFILVLTVAATVKDTTGQVREFIRKNLFKHNKKGYIANAVNMFSQLDRSIELTEVDFRYGRADVYLNTIMHNSNLPIFCRQQKIPMDYLPYNYFHTHSNIMSFVGHLGDNTSFGREITKHFCLRDYITEALNEGTGNSISLTV